MVREKTEKKGRIRSDHNSSLAFSVHELYGEFTLLSNKAGPRWGGWVFRQIFGDPKLEKSALK